MELTWHIVWKSIFIVILGVTLVRLSGRKSISQMSVASTVIMISIGELLAHGIIDKMMWVSTIAVTLFLLTLIIMEWAELKSKWVQKWLSGKTVIVIREGVIDVQQLKKLRMTYGQLEMRLRLKGISHVSDVQTATIEINGEIGFELKKHASPLTYGDLEELMAKWKIVPAPPSHSETKDLFKPEPKALDPTVDC